MVLNILQHILKCFHLLEIDESMRTFIGYIVKSTDEIVKAMELLARKKLVKMRDHAILIKDYERICDEVLTFFHQTIIH